MTDKKTVFIAFAIEDERQRDLLKGQSLHPRSPYEFIQIARLVRPEDFEGRMLVSSDPDVHRAHLQRYLDLGFDRIYLHNVGRNQREFLEVFGREVLPGLSR